MSGSFPPRQHVHSSIVQNWDANAPLLDSPRSGSQTPPRIYQNGHSNGYQNGHDTSCGQEFQTPATPPTTAEDEKLWRDQELNAKIMLQVEQNGITRPSGTTVSFHYSSKVEDMHFGRTHPMKPWRLSLTKHLVLGYGLQYAMDTYEAVSAGKDEVCKFHDPEYVDFLSKVSPGTFDRLCKLPQFARAIPTKHEGDSVELGPFNLSTSPGADCPVFDGMSQYLFLYTGATLAATHKLTSGQSDIAINWSGGLHHAHKSEASGFCYINDIVLSILDMLRVFPRVLYIDIDVHHGDGVEEAFQRQARVMTLSFHRYGTYDDTGHKFFPGTGDIDDVGLRGTTGEHFSLNVPISSGIDDRQYKYLFEEVTLRTIKAFKPSAIVLQCGADSLGGDRLGQFNINIRQHGECVSFVKKQGLPLLILGGGGYTARNVARAWCHETALATNNVLPDTIPMHIVPRPEAFQGRPHGDGKMYPAFDRLHKNECKDSDLEEKVKKLDAELRYVRNSPWVQCEQLPSGNIMQELMDEVDDDRKANSNFERKKKERNPGGRGELR
jgi:histone deacetylase HOS2